MMGDDGCSTQLAWLVPVIFVCLFVDEKVRHPSLLSWKLWENQTRRDQKKNQQPQNILSWMQRGLFLLSAFQLPSMCLSRKGFLSAALFPGTPRSTFIDTVRIYIWVFDCSKLEHQGEQRLARANLKSLCWELHTFISLVLIFRTAQGSSSPPAVRNQSSACLLSAKPS